jgi:hypothetical protein
LLSRDRASERARVHLLRKCELRERAQIMVFLRPCDSQCGRCDEASAALDAFAALDDADLAGYLARRPGSPE